MDSRYSHLHDSVEGVTSQLVEALNLLDDSIYTMPHKVLFNSTIGQHVRHVIELYIELEKGKNSGTVNYDKRERDYQIESNKEYAILLLQGIADNLSSKDERLMLQVGYDASKTEMIGIQTNYFREIAYNIEHTIHHMALIRIGFSIIANIELPSEFGVASSTLKHKQSCAQ